MVNMGSQAFLKGIPMQALIDTSRLQDGDIIFTSIPNKLYQCVERATNSPTSHVGIAIKVNSEWFVAESKVPFSCYTPIDEFIARSKNGWYSVKRVSATLNVRQVILLKSFCDQHMGKLYNFGFKYKSARQFCSKFVYDAYAQSLGIEVGRLQTFRQLLDANPKASRTFWRFWYFGLIPWKRVTVTPSSQYEDERLAFVSAA